MNITELARRLKLSVEVTRHLIPRVGFDIGMKAIKVEDKIGNEIIERVKKSPHFIEEVQIELGLRKPNTEKVDVEKDTSKGSINIPDHIAVRELAQLLQKPVTEVVSELMKNGIFANLNEDIDFETATIIAEDLGYKAERLGKQTSSSNDEAQKSIKTILNEDGTKTERPPVVVIMGHVDHGKTMLLDTIRKSHVVDDEAGGITQHIGAYQIEHKGKHITFIDTPGHEAFTAMRSRGANVADIAILVIAWDDGIKPQTTEAIKIIEKAKLPFVVAITKTDKPESKPDKVLQQLSEINYLPEEWGGKTIVVPVSAKKKEGIEELLNMVLLRLETEKDITADATRSAAGTVIESHVDKGEGPVATVIVQTGTLRSGDLITAGEVAGKVKMLKNDKGVSIKTAGPGTPVRILGLKELPAVGDILQVTKDRQVLKKTLKQQKIRSQALQERKTKIVQQVGEGLTEKERTLYAVLKTDNAGTQEAILESIEKLPQKDVRVQFIRKGVGNVTESDITEAASSEAIVYTFHVSATPTTVDLAQKENVEIRAYEVIYKLIEDIINELEVRLPPEIERESKAQMTVAKLFRQSGKSQIVGGMIQSGTVTPGLHLQISRGRIIIGNGTVTEVRVGSKQVESVKSGTECGIKVNRVPEIKEGDILDLYIEHTHPRKLIQS